MPVGTFPLVRVYQDLRYFRYRTIRTSKQFMDLVTNSSFGVKRKKGKTRLPGEGMKNRGTGRRQWSSGPCSSKGNWDPPVQVSTGSHGTAPAEGGTMNHRWVLDARAEAWKGPAVTAVRACRFFVGGSKKGRAILSKRWQNEKQNRLDRKNGDVLLNSYITEIVSFGIRGTRLGKENRFVRRGKNRFP